MSVDKYKMTGTLKKKIVLHTGYIWIFEKTVGIGQCPERNTATQNIFNSC